MKSDLKTEYAVLRTKWALMRTFLLFCVSLKALIIFSASKHLKNIIYFGLFFIILLVIHYIYCMQKLNKKELINNTFFDYYPLVLIPAILYLMYVSWAKKAAF